MAKAGLKQRPHAAAPQKMRISDDAQRWVAENLLLGAPRHEIASRLVQLGCPLALALQEIERAASHPYLQGAGILQQRLQKRDWLLSTYGRLAAMDGALATVPLVERLPADLFFRDFYSTHRPVLISGLIDGWAARERWSLDYFERELGDPLIEVQTERESNPAYELESPSHRQLLPLTEVLAMLRSGRETNDFYVTANNGGHNRQALARLWDDLGQIEGYLAPREDMDGFFWMGPKGTVTPFHHDLTNNLLIQVRGRKRVTLAPSWDTPKMRNFRHCYSGFGSPEEAAALPEDQRPTLIECVIEPGQALFIPIGWWHHVVGLDMTIGLSFTNFARENDFHASYTTYGPL